MAARKPKKRAAPKAKKRAGPVAKKRTASTAKPPLAKMDAAWQSLLAKAIEQHRAGAAKRDTKPAATKKKKSK